MGVLHVVPLSVLCSVFCVLCLVPCPMFDGQSVVGPSVGRADDSKDFKYVAQLRDFGVCVVSGEKHQHGVELMQLN